MVSCQLICNQQVIGSTPLLAPFRAPFQGSPAEVMYQHQHASLPVEQLEDVPQPIVVLLQVLLEKNPALRFQSQSEHLNAMPTIEGAIDARDRISRHNLQQ